VRGGDNRTGKLFSYVDLEARVRRDHPLRAIQTIVNFRLNLASSSAVDKRRPYGYPAFRHPGSHSSEPLSAN
jgi:hypothetical protein